MLTDCHVAASPRRAHHTITPSHHDFEGRSPTREGLDEGLSVLQAGGADARSTLLTSNVLIALTTPAGAQLWVCIAEAAEGQPSSVEAMANAIERCCSTMAGALFASQLLM